MSPFSDEIPISMESLLEGADRRDPVSLRILYESFAAALYGSILSKVPDPNKAAQILQKTLVYAVLHIRQYNAHLRFLSWIFQIARFKTLEQAANDHTGIALPDDRELAHYESTWSLLNHAEQAILAQAFFTNETSLEKFDRMSQDFDAMHQRLSSALTRFHSLFLQD